MLDPLETLNGDGFIHLLIELGVAMSGNHE